MMEAPTQEPMLPKAFADVDPNPKPPPKALPNAGAAGAPNAAEMLKACQDSVQAGKEVTNFILYCAERTKDRARSSLKEMAVQAQARIDEVLRNSALALCSCQVSSWLPFARSALVILACACSSRPARASMRNGTRSSSGSTRLLTGTSKTCASPCSRKTAATPSGHPPGRVYEHHCTSIVLCRICAQRFSLSLTNHSACGSHSKASGSLTDAQKEAVFGGRAAGTCAHQSAVQGDRI